MDGVRTDRCDQPLSAGTQGARDGQLGQWDQGKVNKWQKSVAPALVIEYTCLQSSTQILDQVVEVNEAGTSRWDMYDTMMCDVHYISEG